jgi:hypothetical protein
MPFSLGELESDSYVREALEHFVESRREADSSTGGWDVDKHSTIRYARSEMDPAVKGRGWFEEFENDREIGGWHVDIGVHVEDQRAGVSRIT